MAPKIHMKGYILLQLNDAPDGLWDYEIARQVLKDYEVDKNTVFWKGEVRATLTDMFSGADIYAVVDRAIEAKLEIALETGEVLPLEMGDLQQAIKLTQPSTKEWFNTAKNYALYANQSGLYDEILKYIK